MAEAFCLHDRIVFFTQLEAKDGRYVETPKMLRGDVGLAVDFVSVDSENEGIVLINRRRVQAITEGWAHDRALALMEAKA